LRVPRAQPYKQVITDLLDWLVPPLLFFVGNYARTVRCLARERLGC
jgi:hypothetical protein